MTEPDDGLGEASQDVSPMVNPRKCFTPYRPTHDATPQTSIFHAAEQQSIHPPHSEYNAERASSAHEHDPQHDSPQPHALQQLANTLRLQALALKCPPNGPSTSWLWNSCSEALEVDVEEEDVDEDPIFRKHQQQMLRSLQTTENGRAPGAAMHCTDSTNPVDNGKVSDTRSASQHSTISTNTLLQHKPLVADIMDTDEDQDDVFPLIPLSSDRRGSLPSQTRTGGLVARQQDGLLFFRRSAQAAALCPLAVHKTARMRKRTKSAPRSAPIPGNGEKGKMVSDQLNACLFPS